MAPSVCYASSQIEFSTVMNKRNPRPFHMSKRQTISPSLRTQLLTEAGYRCAVPTCRTTLAIDLHHIDQVKDDGGNEQSNLIALCPTCHRLYHNGTIPKDAIRAWKKMLVSLSQKPIKIVDPIEEWSVSDDGENDIVSMGFTLERYEFEDYKIVLDNFVPKKEWVDLYILVGDEAGFNCGPNDYTYLPLNQVETESSRIVVAENLAANKQRPGQMEITLYRPQESGTEKRISFSSYTYNAKDMYSRHEGTAIFKGFLTPVTQIRILVSTGGIHSANVRLYGEGGGDSNLTR